jgi:hypothetical protein
MTYFVRFKYEDEEGIKFKESHIITTDKYLVDMDDVESLIHAETGVYVDEVLAFSQINIGHEN